MNERIKPVNARKIYKDSQMNVCFHIPEEDAPFDRMLGDRIGAVCFAGIEKVVDTLKESDYDDEEINRVFDRFFESRELDDIILPKPVKVEVQYYD